MPYVATVWDMTAGNLHRIDALDKLSRILRLPTRLDVYRDRNGLILLQNNGFVFDELMFQRKLNRPVQFFEASEPHYAKPVLLITNETWQRNVPAVFLCRNEPFRLDGPILVPLGNGSSSQYIVKHGLEVLRCFNRPIIFYHTTYRNDRYHNQEPRQHMERQVAQLLYHAQQTATRLGLEHTTIIELADSVVGGLIQAAIRENCDLIVMAPGLDTIRGSYVDGVIKHSRIPMLIFNRIEEV